MAGSDIFLIEKRHPVTIAPRPPLINLEARYNNVEFNDLHSELFPRYNKNKHIYMCSQ